jgi:hypothetical protein
VLRSRRCSRCTAASSEGWRISVSPWICATTRQHSSALKSEAGRCTYTTNTADNSTAVGTTCVSPTPSQTVQGKAQKTHMSSQLWC